MILVSIVIIAIDPISSRSFSVAGSIMNLAGAYWIASGVVLRATDIADLTRVSISPGPRYIGKDPIKDIIPSMLRVQSRRAKFGLFCILAGTVGQIVGTYVA